MAYQGPVPQTIASGGTNSGTFSTSGAMVCFDGMKLACYSGPQLAPSGVITNSKQPCFSTKVSTNVSSVTGDNTAYTVLFNSVLFDQTSSYSPTTGIYTAPVAGKHLFCWGVGVFGLGLLNTAASLLLVYNGSATASSLNFNPFALLNLTVNIVSYAGSCLVMMNANDTIKVTIAVSGTGKTVGVSGGNAVSNFSGVLLC